MVNDKLKLNTIIEIEDEGKKYLCRVQDLVENTLSIDIPVCGQEYLFLNADDEIEISYLVENECYYKGTCKVIKRYKNNIYMYLVTRPQKIKKIQRRNFVRTRTLDNIKYRKVSKEEWKTGIMLDLSGGGMRACLKETLQEGDKIKIEFGEDEGKLKLDGEIVRIEDAEAIYGVEFTDMDERKRDKIVKKVFTIMLKERKRI